MKPIIGLSLVGMVVGSVLSGGLFTAAEAASTCSAPVYTDGGQHYVGACGQGGSAQVNELSAAPSGSTFASVQTGQAPVDALLPIFALPTPSDQCTPKPTDIVVVYTDGLKHYAGVCAKGASVQFNEISAGAMGRPFLTVKSGQAPVDALLPTLAVPTPRSGTQCTANAGDMVVIYTDALQHVLGACDSSGNNIQVQEVMGSLKDRNNLIDLKTMFGSAQVQTQAEGGASGVLIHPKVVVTPAG